MRVLLIFLALVLIGSLLGWITFSKAPDRSSVNIETETIRSDTKKAVQSSATLLEKAGKKIGEKAQETLPAPKTPASSVPAD